MIFNTLCKEYINDNKAKFLTYIVISSLFYIIKVVLTPMIYSSIVELNETNFIDIVKNVGMLWITIGIFCIIKSRIENQLFPEFLSFLRQKLLKLFLEKNKYNFDDSNVSTDITRILEVTRYMKEIFSWICQYIIPVISLTLFITVYFMYNIPILGFINILCNLCMIWFISSKYESLVENSNNRETEYMDMVTKLDENFNNLLNILINNQVDHTLKENEKNEKEYTETYKKQNNEVIYFVNTLKLINYLFAFISIYVLYLHAKHKNVKNQSKQFVRIILIFTFYISTLENLSEDIPWYIMTVGNIKNAEPFLKDNVYYENKEKEIDDLNGDIVFDNVSFKYKDTFIFKDFSLHIKHLKRIGIIGKTGKGKSTLMKLLLKLYKTQEGSIYINNNHIDEINVDKLRSHFNYINQKTVLFNDTILNNMKYGNDKNDQYITQLLQKYDLLRVFSTDADVNSLQTLVKTNGSNISMGMQKVIFLVRGLLKESNVYILDEPFSSIDQKTRDKIFRLIDDYTKGKTTIIITHDINHLDEILDEMIEI